MEHLKGTSTGNRSQAVHQSATLPKKKKPQLLHLFLWCINNSMSSQHMNSSSLLVRKRLELKYHVQFKHKGEQRESSYNLGTGVTKKGGKRIRIIYADVSFVTAFFLFSSRPQNFIQSFVYRLFSLLFCEGNLNSIAV